MASKKGMRTGVKYGLGNEDRLVEKITKKEGVLNAYHAEEISLAERIGKRIRVNPDGSTSVEIVHSGGE